MDPAGPVASRFPLIARPRPACDALDARVSKLCALAGAAERAGDQAAASAVHNQAALLASDVGLPGLAREWCHRHADMYLRACPLDAQAARRALEPLVNLARLHIRDGHGDRAHHLLNALHQAVASRADTVVDGLPVPAATLTATEDEHRELRTWLWTVLLADCTRALTSVGRWQDAHAHLQQRKGIGRRMLDGRQVAVIASATAGEADRARELLMGTAPGDRWENAVTSCLTVLCRRDADQSIDRDLAAMPAAMLASLLGQYQQLDRATPLIVFHTRLGLTVIDAIGDVEHPAARRIAADLICRARASRDGYAARDVLAHHGCAAILSDDQRGGLAEVVHASALGRREIPAKLSAGLSAALATSETVLSRAMAARPTSR